MTTTTDNNKRIAKNTMMLYIRMLLIMGVTLYTSRVVLNQLGVVDYGIYNVVGGIVVALSFLNGAMAQSTQRFLSFELGKENFNRLKIIFSHSVFVHIIIGVSVVILAETIGLWFLNNKMNLPENQMQVAGLVYQISIISFLISVLQVPYNAAIVSHEKMNVYAYISVLEGFLKLGTACLLIVIPTDKLYWYAMMTLLNSLVFALIYIGYCKIKFEECKVVCKFDSRVFKSITSFAGWNIFGSFAWVGKNQGLNLILNMFCGPAINAAYGISNQVNVAVNSFVQNFSMAINPRIVKTYAIRDYVYLNRLICNGAKLSFMLLFALAFPIIFLAEKILAFWLISVPEYAVVFTQLILLISLLESFTYAMGASLQATGDIRTYQIIVACTILLNLPMGWMILNSGFKPYSVFFVSFVISVFTLAERILIMKRVIPEFSIKTFVLQVFLPSLCVVVTSVIGIYLIDMFFKIKELPLFVGGIITFCICASCIYVFGFTKNERNKFRYFVRTRYILK